MSESISFWVPSLGGQSLSSNAKDGKRHPMAVYKAKEALQEAAYFAALEQLGPLPAKPRIEFSDILLDFHICYGRRPKDGIYRFTDPSNGGGDVAKPIVDALRYAKVIPDDTYKHVRMFSTHITPVETLAEEGVQVTVRPVIEEAAA